MQTVKDQNANLAINEGMSLVNRYLNNGLLNFNIQGNIPSRSTYFNSLLTNNNNDVAAQTVITNNFKQTSFSGFNLTDYLSVNLHWYGIDFNLEPKLISIVLIALINKCITKIIDQVVGNLVDKWIDALALELKTTMFEAAEELMGELDTELVEQPEIIAILDPIYTAMAYTVANEIEQEIKNILKQTIEHFIDEDKNTLEKLFNLLEKNVTHSLDKNTISFELQIDIHWIVWKSTIQLVPIFPQEDLPFILIPSHPSLIFNGVNSVLTGNTNDFTLIINASDFNEFANWISHDTNWNKYDGGNAWLHCINIYNSNVILTNDQWKEIITKLEIINLDDGYAACIHVVRQVSQDFQIAYTNLTKEDKYNIPLPMEMPWLKDSIIGNKNSSNLIITNSQFRSLLNAYDYAINNWVNISKDTNVNPNKYTDVQTWFYHTYIICDSLHVDSDVSFWISNKLDEATIMNFFNKCYDDFYLQNENNKLDFINFISNTSDNINQILNISNINL